MKLRIGQQTFPIERETRWRHRFSIVCVLAAVALIGWGGFVTSINAGLAVPDWPTSFGSFDPFTTGFHDPSDPAADWWERVPILAEHGHRLLGMLMGLLTIVLAGWTWQADPRRWMRRLSFIALALVIVQGVLGGLRVVLTSIDLAVVHACVAQLFFSLLVAMTLFTAPSWLQAEGRPRSGASTPGVPDTARLSRLRLLTVLTAGALYGQIILGALLRHPGIGIDPMLAGIHMMGAFVAAGLIVATFITVHQHFRVHRLLRRAARVLLGLLGLQFVLGFTAYFVLLDERGVLQPSNFQVIVNTSHLIVGTLLMAAAVSLALLALRPAPAAAAEEAAPAQALAGAPSPSAP